MTSVSIAPPATPLRGRRDGLVWFVGLFVLYYGLSALILGRHALAHPTSQCACIGSGDPPQFMWSLEWWPYAISHCLHVAALTL